MENHSLVHYAHPLPPANGHGPERRPPAAGDTVDVTQLWSSLRDNARVIGGIGAGTFCVVMVICLLSHMTFRARGQLYLGELADKARDRGTELDLPISGRSDLGSEIEVLRSRSMIRRAILSSGLNVRIAPAEWRPPRYWRWLLSARDPKLLDPAASELIATESALVEGEREERSYRVEFVDASNYRLSAKGYAALEGRLGEPLDARGVQLSLLLEAGQAGPRVGTAYELTVKPLEQTVDQVLEELTITAPKPAPGGESVKVLKLEYAHPSPRAAATFLDHLMRTYLEERQSWKTEEATAVESFVTKQLAGMQRSLDRSEERLAEFRSKNRVVVLENEAEAMVEQIGKYEEQRIAALLQVGALRDVQRALQRPNPSPEAYMLGEATDSVLAEMATSLAEAQRKLSELHGRFQGAAPDVKQQASQVRAQLSMIRNYVANRLLREEENLAALTRVIEELEAKLRTVPSAQLSLAQLGRESEVYSRMYSYLLERQQQAAIGKASKVSQNRVLDAPQVPLREDSPKLGLHLAGGLIGLLFGAVFVLLRNLFSGACQGENDMRGMLDSIQVVGRVPQRLWREERPGAPLQPPQVFDVLGEQPDFAYAEAFRTLRANLYHRLRDGQGKVIMITSPVPNDGKTTCVLSLAAIFAADAKRVLVIDADVRKASHHTLIGTRLEPGLQEIIRDKRVLDRAFHVAALSNGWFHSISAGAGSLPELLADEQFALLLGELRSHYDFVLLDSPSYPIVSDPLILAPHADLVLSVVRLGSTPRRLTEEHLRGMLPVARNYAVLLNGVPRPLGYHRYSYGKESDPPLVIEAG